MSTGVTLPSDKMGRIPLDYVLCVSEDPSYTMKPGSKMAVPLPAKGESIKAVQEKQQKFL